MQLGRELLSGISGRAFQSPLFGAPASLAVQAGVLSSVMAVADIIAGERGFVYKPCWKVS